MKFQCDCGVVVLELNDGEDEVVPCLCVSCQKERRENERLLPTMQGQVHPSVLHDGG